MQKFDIAKVEEIMNSQDSIRNMSVIAHVDHGKTTLTDSLIAYNGIISLEKVGSACTMDTSEEEKNRGITIKSTGVTLFYEMKHQQKKDLNNNDQQTTTTESNQDSTQQSHRYLINLIDCPGHVDFSSEVTAALRVTDGALVVVDYIEGVCVQTETVLRQALAEKIVPVLMVNKIDRGILELQVSGEEMYQRFLRVIESVNVVISTYEQEDSGLTLQVDPTQGNVAFGAALFGWAFTLDKFAKMYEKKFGIDEKILAKKLWGDNFYDPQSKKFVTEEVTEDGRKLQRAFVQFIMDPIIKLMKNIMEEKTDNVFKMCNALEITLSERESHFQKKDLVRAVFMKWLNAGEVLLEMICKKLPSPKQAQQYRTSFLYEGPQDDPCAVAMKNCDPNGPLMIYISKMVKSNDKGRFYAFGRVFSGTARSGQKVRIMGPNYIPGKTVDLFVKSIQRTVLMMANKVEPVSEVPCGNTIGLVGIDKYLVKSGTITDYDEAHNIRPMKYSVSPVVRIAVKPRNPQDLPKLIEGLKSLAKADSLVQCFTVEETGEHIIAGCGELHLEVCLKELEKEHAQIPIDSSDPVVSYMETVTAQSSQVCLAKSQNKHNRIYAVAEPLGEEFCQAVDLNQISAKDEPKEQGKKLVEEYGWDINDSRKIWCFGPEETGCNLLVDQTKGIQYLNEIKDHMKSAFQWATKEGAMTQEQMRGVRVNIVDCNLISDSIHRGGGQILPAGRRVIYAAQLTAEPRLLEPIFLCEIQAPDSVVGGIYQVISQRRGMIISEEPIQGQPTVILKAYLPVAESFGFTQHLRAATQGKAFPQCVFDHWQVISSDPFQSDSKAGQIVDQIRKRKGLKPGIPELSNYLDKL